MKKALTIMCVLCCILSGCGSAQSTESPVPETAETVSESVAESAEDTATYEDIPVGDLIFTAAAKCTLTNRGKNSTSLDVKGQNSVYHVQAFVEDLGNDTIWLSSDMEEHARVMHILESAPADFDPEKAWDTPCDVTSESVSGFEVYKLNYNNVDGLIACRQYGNNKYTLIARADSVTSIRGSDINAESLLDHYDDFKELLNNIKLT